jgi:hypothetical protein
VSAGARWHIRGTVGELVLLPTQVLGLHVGLMDTDMTKGYDLKKNQPRDVAAHVSLRSKPARKRYWRTRAQKASSKACPASGRTTSIPLRSLDARTLHAMREWWRALERALLQRHHVERYMLSDNTSSKRVGRRT